MPRKFWPPRKSSDGTKRLYGIFITNFGCGPDSFILHFFQDIMRGKPYLEIEIDEHSSDVGAVTRLEAFLDSLQNVKVPEEMQSLLSFRGRHTKETRARKIFVPDMTDHAQAVAASFAAVGVEAEVLPASDSESLALGRKLTSGKECYPCILTTGDMVRVMEQPDFDPEKMAFMMPTSNGPCRFGQYHRFQRLVLDELGYQQVPIYSPDQGDSLYEELEMVGGNDFSRIAWSTVVAIDLIIKKRLETRSYEVDLGDADKAYQESLADILETTRNRGDMIACLRRCRERQEAVKLRNPGSRPIVGVVGEIYTRNNDFSNENTIRNIERFGGEPWLPTVAEWILYVNQDAMDVSRLQRRWKDHFKKRLINHFQVKKMHELEETYHGSLRNNEEPSTIETFNLAAPFVHRTFQGETILSMGKSVDFRPEGRGRHRQYHPLHLHARQCGSGAFKTFS